jgi:N-sulfoglucosamine sulfohydrolase
MFTMNIPNTRPNILFAFADDWGRYASCYEGIEGSSSLCSLIETPNIDRIAREGVLFSNPHVPAPTCTPCRSSILSGRYFWQTKLGAILSGAVFDSAIPTYPLILEESGYDIGFTYKVWGPGVALDDTYAGRKNQYVSGGTSFNSFSFAVTENMNSGAGLDEAMRPLFDEVRANFREFLADRSEGKPFCYWWGPTNTHRTWQKGSGSALWGIEPDSLKGRMPSFFPDVHDVREDVADYLGECMAFDRGLGTILDELEERGELDNTLIVVSGDHGIPGFPRAKCNLYDVGSEVALVARLPDTIPSGRVVEDMVNIMSLAPTFLEIGCCERPEGMVADSLLPLLLTDQEGLIGEEDNFVVTGRERHVAHARQWNLPYPTRALRTPEYTYIRNFRPDRWPVGDPKGMDDLSAPPIPWETLESETYAAYPDMDSSPTKAWMVHHRGEEAHMENYRLGFGKRPEEELYHNAEDPDQMTNLADSPTYRTTKEELKKKLMRVLIDQHDPRATEEDCRFDHSPYTDLKVNGKEFQESIALSKLRLEMS